MKAPISHSVELIEDIPDPQEHLDTSSTSTSSATEDAAQAALTPVTKFVTPAPATAHAAPSVNEYVTPTPVVNLTAPAPVMKDSTPASVFGSETPIPSERKVLPGIFVGKI